MESEQPIEHFEQMENCIDQAIVPETIEGFDTNKALTEILTEATGIGKKSQKALLLLFQI